MFLHETASTNHLLRGQFRIDLVCTRLIHHPKKKDLKQKPKQNKIECQKVNLASHGLPLDWEDSGFPPLFNCDCTKSLLHSRSSAVSHFIREKAQRVFLYTVCFANTSMTRFIALARAVLSSMGIGEG